MTLLKSTTHALIATFFLAIAVEAQAQITFPPLSPAVHIHQQAGLSTFTLRYGRPAARGRKIFGGLVPFDTVWRTGAGPATKLGFNTPVTIGDKIVPPGTYALLTIPAAAKWTVILNRDTTLFTTAAAYTPSNDVVRVEVKPTLTNRYNESLAITFDIRDNDAVLLLSWENTEIAFPIGTGTNTTTITSITQELLSGKSTDSEMYSQAVEYYYMNNLNLPQALTLADKALALKKDRWYYRQKADLLEKMKRYPEAITAAQAGIDFLKQTKPEAWEASVKYLQRKIDQWKRMGK